MRSPDFSRPKNTAEIAAMPEGKPTHGASSRCASMCSTASQVGIVEAAVLTEAGGIARAVEHRGHGQRQRDGIALGKSVAAQMGKGGRA